MARPKKETQAESTNAVLTNENVMTAASNEDIENKQEDSQDVVKVDIPPKEEISNKEDKDINILKDKSINSSTKETTEAPEKDKEIKLEKHIEDILKVYPQYKELYIDSKGGVYATDTNQNIRGNAILYKNPYNNNNN